MNTRKNQKEPKNTEIWQKIKFLCTCTYGLVMRPVVVELHLDWLLLASCMIAVQQSVHDFMWRHCCMICCMTCMIFIAKYFFTRYKI